MRATATSILALMLMGPATGAEDRAPIAMEAKGPVIVDGTSRLDFTSRVTGRSYRLMVAKPIAPNGAQRLPVFYVLDGNFYFAAAANQARFASNVPRIGLSAAIIVGIGYPTDSLTEALSRHSEEFALPGGGRSLNHQKINSNVDAFIRIIIEEAMPMVESLAQIDTENQSIYGHSLGGLIVVRLLLQHPRTFSTYIAADPSTGGVNLPHMADALASSSWRQDPQSEVSRRIRVLVIGSGTGRTTITQYFASLGDRISAIDLVNDNHASMTLPALGRALQFALGAATATAK